MGFLVPAPNAYMEYNLYWNWTVKKIVGNKLVHLGMYA